MSTRRTDREIPRVLDELAGRRAWLYVRESTKAQG
jgi:hypothetical protein